MSEFWTVAPFYICPHCESYGYYVADNIVFRRCAIHREPQADGEAQSVSSTPPEEQPGESKVSNSRSGE